MNSWSNINQPTRQKCVPKTLLEEVIKTELSSLSLEFKHRFGYNRGMKISILAKDIDLTPSIKKYVEMKMGVLGKTIGKYEKEGALTLFVEIARSTKHHKHGDVFYAEAMLGLPGKTLRAEHFHSDIRVAINGVKGILKEKISKYKGKVEVRVQRKKK